MVGCDFYQSMLAIIQLLSFNPKTIVLVVVFGYFGQVFNLGNIEFVVWRTLYAIDIYYLLVCIVGKLVYDLLKIASMGQNQITFFDVLYLFQSISCQHLHVSKEASIANANLAAQCVVEHQVLANVTSNDIPCEHKRVRKQFHDILHSGHEVGDVAIWDIHAHASDLVFVCQPLESIQILLDANGGNKPLGVFNWIGLPALDASPFKFNIQVANLLDRDVLLKATHEAPLCQYPRHPWRTSSRHVRRHYRNALQCVGGLAIQTCPIECPEQTYLAP